MLCALTHLQRRGRARIVVVLHRLDLPEDLRTDAGHLAEVALQHDRILGAAHAAAASDAVVARLRVAHLAELPDAAAGAETATEAAATLLLLHAATLQTIVGHRSGSGRPARTGGEVRHRSSIFLQKRSIEAVLVMGEFAKAGSYVDASACIALRLMKNITRFECNHPMLMQIAAHICT